MTLREEIVSYLEALEAMQSECVVHPVKMAIIAIVDKHEAKAQEAELEQLRAGNTQLKRDLALVRAANARMREDLKEYENDPTR